MTRSPDIDKVSRVRELLALHRETAGPLMPLLHAIQDEMGYVPAEVIAPLADGLNLSRAEVHGVVSYYHFFRRSSPGRRVVQICQAESCRACGAEELLAQAEQVLGCKAQATRADGEVSLEQVYCLGLCALSPALVVDQRVYALMSPAKLASLASDLGLTA